MACTPLLSEEDLYRFRTKQCLRLAKGGCEFGLDRCQYSHNAEWIRRCPYYISLPSYLRYIPVSCPFFTKKEKQTDEQDEEHRSTIFRNSLFLTNKDGSVNNNFYKYMEEKNQSKCPLGVECPLAHSKEEIDYHPLLYKTKRCEDYKQANCSRYYCPNLHGLAEQRKIKEYFIPFSSKIEIPPYPNVTVVSKIQYGSFKGQNQGRTTAKKTTPTQQGCNSSSLYFNYPHGKNNHSHRGANRMTNVKVNRSVDVKCNSISIPCQEKKLSLQDPPNHGKRHSTHLASHLADSQLHLPPDTHYSCNNASLPPTADNIFLNQKYCHILNHILHKNLELTKNKMTEKNHSVVSSYTEGDIPQKGTPNDSTNAQGWVTKNLSSQGMAPEEGDNQSYESFLNLLVHVLCLLYFTTDSRAHSSFDLYTHELAKRLHCESKKMRDISVEKYLASGVKELI
ncbi:D13 protein [Plasmodium vivax Brazil I]|uniref:D13 protein n=1 Tax=Plasmodium vivax (strain Brazil I) TaxID=1033975 RepID=A0A0J9SZB7_PLAV1|nr:D13 protein [Plasmodium vivax Brazil I]